MQISAQTLPPGSSVQMALVTHSSPLPTLLQDWPMPAPPLQPAMAKRPTMERDPMMRVRVKFDSGQKRGGMQVPATHRSGAQHWELSVQEEQAPSMQA